MRITNGLLSGVSILAVSLMGATGEVVSQDDEEELVFEEVLVTGTRGKPRTAMQSPVAIDVFDSATIERQGNGDLTETLKNMVPSFNATPLTGDGAAFVRPTSLRGLPPDQTLVLVNSKRRHRSALISHFGAAMNVGSQAVDVGMIPSIALKNLEVLRDGAAAQYGSDAIAGVMNFILKDADEGGEIQGQIGQWFDGETDYRIAANWGVALGDSGFINMSAEYTDYQELSRGFPHAAAAANPLSDGKGMNWGRPASNGLRAVWNAGFDLGDDRQLYSFGNFADTKGSYSFFYRSNTRSDVMNPIPINPNDPSEGNFCFCDVMPGGFTPYLDGMQRDFSSVTGIKGESDGGLSYDISVGVGSNRIDYLLRNTINLSWGPEEFGQGLQDMETGDLKQSDANFNADFSYEASDQTIVSFGGEWRREKYTMFPGSRIASYPGRWAEVSSLINPDTGENYAAPGRAANGLAGTSRETAGSWNQKNYAAYVDVEHNFSDAFLLQAALRYEDYNTFGSTTNGKVAFRYSASDDFVIRGAVSTGFRAPTPGQANVETITTSFDGVTGTQVLEGTVSPTSATALANGGAPLRPEDAFNISLGFTANIGESTALTVDAYRIDVDDRIMKTRSLAVVDPNFDEAAFYTNALDTLTKGFDVVLNTDVTDNTKVTLAYNYNKTTISEVREVNGEVPFSSSFLDNLQYNLPKHKATLSAVHSTDTFTIGGRAIYYSSVVDERAPYEKAGAEILLDVDITYHVNESLDLTLGANNLLDNYPDEVSSRQSQGMPYMRRTPIGYHGGMAYLRTTYRF